MAQGASISEGSSGENITHFSSMRIRAIGNSSQLRLRILSTDDLLPKTLVAYPANPSQRVIPTRLINYMSQRASIELKTTGFDETFRINRITVFTKEVFKEYP